MLVDPLMGHHGVYVDRIAEAECRSQYSARSRTDD